MPWHYPWGQLELTRLHILVRRGFAANRHVDYVDNFGLVSAEAAFRWRAPAGVTRIRATGAIDVRSPAGLSATRGTSAHDVEVRLRQPAELVVGVSTGPQVPPAVLVVADALGVDSGVEVRAQDGTWRPTAVRLGPADRPPHEEREPVVELEGRWVDGVFELPAPVLGRPVIDCSVRPTISAGESRAEALHAAEADHETRQDLVRRPDGRWTSRHLLGFRHLVVHAEVPVQVLVEAQVHPAPRRGAFVCSDERLNRIWSTSAYTLRLCMQELTVDGIKRDRMPWMGDQALGAMTTAYAFADRQAVHDTLVALGQPRHGYVNGIADYSLWWVVGCGFFTRFFDAGDDVARLAQNIHELLQELVQHATDDGVLRPAELPGQFTTHIFVDWGLDIDASRDFTALQVLWFWALRSGSSVLLAARHPGAARWTALARSVRETLLQRGWEPTTGSWREYLDDPGPAVTPYADFLSVAAGLSDPGSSPGVGRVLRAAGRAGTPFMTAFALQALGRAGHRHEAVERLGEWWGQMLDAGARTFWEDFGDAGDDHAMYGRPFGKSLCHAWSAGPVALLPELVLGLRPLEEGWRVFEVDVDLGDLRWASAVVPVPGGEIVVAASREQVVVDVPAGTVLRECSRGDLGPGRWVLDGGGPRRHRLSDVVTASTEEPSQGTPAAQRKPSSP